MRQEQILYSDKIMQAAQYMCVCVCVCVRCTRIQQGVVVDRWFKLPHHYIWHLSSSFGGIHGYAWLVAGTLPRLGKLAAEETGLGRGKNDVYIHEGVLIRRRDPRKIRERSILGMTLLMDISGNSHLSQEYLPSPLRNYLKHPYCPYT